MKYTLLIFLLANCLFISSSYAQTDLQLTLEYDGITRDYRIHLPPQYTGGVSLPLVLNLHGNTSNAVQQEFYTQFVPLSNEKGFIVCHPDGLPIPGGTGNTWNVSFQGGADTDDTGFISALIDRLHIDYDIDLTRVYSTGMSNGGYMSYKLACETNRIAAIASVTGSMVPSELANCSPIRATPIMQIHGTTDPVVPYEGAVWTTGIESLVDWWVAHNGCMDGPAITDVPDINTDDGCTAELYEYTSCDDGTKVEFYKITNGGHTWPEGLVETGAGNTNRDFNASAIIWEFFSQYQFVGATSVSNIAKDLEMNIAPNPAKDLVTIQIEGVHILSVELYNILGELVYNQQLEGNYNVEIPVSNLSKGTYILKVNTEKGIVSEKLVKQ
ncbi:MAG: polyhydroxybutyrate depolymerase [Maribacter sp.]|jgi:polyhydroxybutyrate depolymerase